MERRRAGHQRLAGARTTVLEELGRPRVTLDPQPISVIVLGSFARGEADREKRPAIHAAINAADAVTGQRMGRRGAGQDHDQVLSLLREAGKDGAGVEKSLARLLPPKAKTEYEPDEVPLPVAERAVERAPRCVATARRAARPA